MKALSSRLSEELISDLKTAAAKGLFGKISFQHAMEFLLSDGVLPASHLPVDSFLRLEDWVLAYSANAVSYTATELKNKTGEVLDQVLSGKTVKLTKHGRPFAEIKRIEA